MKKFFYLVILFIFISVSKGYSQDKLLIVIKEEGNLMIQPELSTLRTLFVKNFNISNAENFKTYYVGNRVVISAENNSGNGPSAVRLYLESSNGKDFYLYKQAEGESCVGNNCSKCSFAKGGGCICLRGDDLGACNHVITRNMIIFFYKKNINK